MHRRHQQPHQMHHNSAHHGRPVGPHGRPIDYMTGCEEPPAFHQSLSPAAMSVRNPGVHEPIEDVILDGEVGNFQITRQGGFPTPTIKAVVSSALRTRSRHPDPAEFGFGTCPGVKNLHALRLREISIPDNLPNVSRHNNRLYINTVFFDDDYDMIFQNFVTEVPISNYLNVNHLLASVDNAIEYLRYHPAREGLEENHADQHAEWGVKYSKIRPPLSLSTTFDEKRSRVGIASFGKTTARFVKDIFEISYMESGIVYDVSFANVKFPTHTIRAEETTSPGSTEKISNVKIVDVSIADAVRPGFPTGSGDPKRLRFLEFEVPPGRHNLAVGDRVMIHDVSFVLSFTPPEMWHVAYVRKGALKSNDVLRVYLYTASTGAAASTAVELGANPRIEILDLAQNNIGPMLGFRHHTRLGLGADLVNGGHNPFLTDVACVSPGAVELSHVHGGSKALTFKTTSQPLFPPQTYGKSKNNDVSMSQVFESENVEDRASNLNTLDNSFGACLLVVNGDTGSSHDLKAAEFFVPGIHSTDTELISSNVLRVPESALQFNLNTVLADTTSAAGELASHVYPQSFWGWKRKPEDAGVHRNMSNWAVTFGTAALNMSHLNQYVLVRVTRNGEQLGSIVTPQSRRTGNRYLAKLHFLRSLDGGTGRLFTTASGGLHVFQNPVREDSLTTSPDDGTPPDETYTIELLDQNERRLDISGDEWDFVMEYISFR